MQAFIDSHRFPAIWINVKQDHDCIHADDLACGYDAARHLLDLGHRRIAFCMHRCDHHYSTADRLAGFRKAMTDAGLPALTLGFRHSPHAEDHIGDDDRLGQCMDMLRSPDRPTGIVCYSSAEALSLLYAAAVLGIRVPDQLSIIGISDYFINHFGRVASTVRVSTLPMGRRAVDMLRQRLDQPDLHLPGEAVQPILSIGFSTAPPPVA